VFARVSTYTGTSDEIDEQQRRQLPCPSRRRRRARTNRERAGKKGLGAVPRRGTEPPTMVGGPLGLTARSKRRAAPRRPYILAHR
jgi:hypothetical protein